jgi:hypothetical protein
VTVQTRSGDLTVSQSVSTSSTSSNTTTPALKLSAGSTTAAGTATGGDIVLLGSPTLLVGTGGTAVFYSGSASNANGLALTGALSSKANNYIEYTKSAADAPAAAFGYSALFRQSPIVIYMRVRTGQSSTYGTADRTLTYCYSVGSGSCQPTNYAGIPTEDQSFSLANSAVSSLINVSGGVSGSLLLSGNAFVASGFATSTDTGSYMMTLKPTLTLAGYVFKAGGAVAYAITPKPVRRVPLTTV